MEANKILSADLLDLLFENRNKDYGAYQLRKTYNRRITKALLITASVALLALLGSFIANKVNASKEKFKKTEMTLTEIAPEEEKKVEPPPPPPPVEPPKVEMKQFTPPVIKKDEEVKEDEKPPEQEELKDVKIDVQNQEGVKDEAPTVSNIDEGKQVVEEKKEEDENHIFEKVEIEASFPGGTAAWSKYLRNNLRAEIATENGAPAGTYTVNVRFVVDKEGNISDVRALSSHGYGIEDEAVRAIKKGPRWSPGNQNGRAVNSYHTQPITFVVTEE
jgi:periplasmic protein TonB